MKYHPGDDVIKAAHQLTQIDHAFMDVERFRTRYLPRFWENDGTVYEEWLRHIGTPFRRCDLVSQGKKVGEVPPLAKQVETATAEGGRYSLYERLTTLQNHIKRLPQAETRLTEAALKDLFKETGPDPELIKEWDELFKAFGYPGYLGNATEDADDSPDERVQFNGFEEL
jgi:hypothetical protein